MPKQNENKANVAVFLDQLRTFNSMYKTDVDSKKFSETIAEAWDLLIKDDNPSKLQGKEKLSEIFKDTAKKAIDLEKNIAYNEHRLPEYTEIIKSTNKLMRASMFAYTDMYHNPERESLFESTAFGGLYLYELADLTSVDSLFKMDQRSDEAWKIQSQEAKDLAETWLKEPKPYERMIQELNQMVENSRDQGRLEKRDIALKLTAAEWLLVNNEKMMIDDPEDPLNQIPDWGNRYWKAITQAREAFGISKYSSMRDIIQSEYEACAKAVRSYNYNQTQIKENVLSKEAREEFDSMEEQKEQFAILSASVVLKDNGDKQNEKDEKEFSADDFRINISVESQNERVLMQQQPKKFDFILKDDSKMEMKLPNQNPER